MPTETAGARYRANQRAACTHGKQLTGRAMRRVPLGEGFARFAEAVGDRLYELRRQLGVSSDELAAACGVHVSTVHRWESNHGGRAITLPRVVQIAKALGVMPIDLMPREEV